MNRYGWVEVRKSAWRNYVVVEGWVFCSVGGSQNKENVYFDCFINDLIGSV